jgi:hypothetical protein
LYWLARFWCPCAHLPRVAILVALAVDALESGRIAECLFLVVAVDVGGALGAEVQCGVTELLVTAAFRVVRARFFTFTIGRTNGLVTAAVVIRQALDTAIQRRRAI